jgi:DNA topoisomerase-6 subunit B
VPFTSESKEAVANYPEIVKELRLALQECGRRVSTYIRRTRREADEAKKRGYIEKYIPHVAIALQEILGFDDPEKQRVIQTLTKTLERSRSND